MRRRVFVILQAVTLSVTAAGVARAQTLEERRERVLARDAELTNVAPPRPVQSVWKNSPRGRSMRS